MPIFLNRYSMIYACRYYYIHSYSGNISVILLTISYLKIDRGGGPQWHVITCIHSPVTKRYGLFDKHNCNWGSDRTCK